MDLLLDTHVFLWWDMQAADLSASAWTAISNPANRVFVSAASTWEIAIKSRKGKLGFSGSPTQAINRNGFLELAILPIQGEMTGLLDWDHSDPFNRVLVAQALSQSMTLVHADGIIRDSAGLSQFWAR